MPATKKRIQTRTFTAPEHWASYLVNGDATSFDYDENGDTELRAAEKWLESIAPWSIVDVKRDKDGEPLDARFTWSYRLYGGTANGGSVIDYIAHKLP